MQHTARSKAVHPFLGPVRVIWCAQRRGDHVLVEPSIDVAIFAERDPGCELVDREHMDLEAWRRMIVRFGKLPQEEDSGA